MAKFTITGSIFYRLCPYTGTESFSFFNFDATATDPGYVRVGPHTIEYEVPADFNPVAAQLAALQKQRDNAAKQFADTVRMIDAQIGKLTAICNEVAA